MANEITFQGSLTVYKASVMTSGISRVAGPLLINMTGNFVIEATMTVTTAAVAIPLGSVTAPAWGFFLNKDATNFIRLHNGSGGAKVVKMLAGEPAFFRFDDTATPFATADTASCIMEYFLCSL